MNARLLSRRPESPVAATLGFDVPGFAYRAGQWIKIDPHQFPAIGDALRARAAQRGKPEGAAYFSIASDSLRPGYLEISVKVSDRPGGSPLAAHLVHGLRAGDVVALDGPGGSYGYPEPLPKDVEGIVHVCAGSGAAPNRGLIREALGRGLPLKHLLILQDRTPEDRFYAAEWAALEKAEPGRFRLRAAHSRTSKEYISTPLIAAAAAGYVDPKRCLALVCGPKEVRGTSPSFCDLARMILKELGVPADRILGE